MELEKFVFVKLLLEPIQHIAPPKISLSANASLLEVAVEFVRINELIKLPFSKTLSEPFIKTAPP